MKPMQKAQSTQGREQLQEQDKEQDKNKKGSSKSNAQTSSARDAEAVLNRSLQFLI